MREWNRLPLIGPPGGLDAIVGLGARSLARSSADFTDQEQKRRFGLINRENRNKRRLVVYRLGVSLGRQHGIFEREYRRKTQEGLGCREGE